MPGEDIHSWSTVAADNGSADSLINWVEGQPRASVNNSSRSEMAAHAKDRNLNNGSIVTTGSTNAQAFLSGVTYTSIPTGLRATLKVGAGLTNTGPTTLNMDGIGAVAVKTADGVDMLSGEFVSNGYIDLIYNGTNWIFLYGREFMFDRITGGGGIIIGQQIFSTPGTFTYTPTPGMECCIVECLGGGGAGGGVTAPPNTNTIAIAPGGGSGGYSRKYLNVADVGGAQTVTVGAGGVGVAYTTGASGTASSFGSLCVANGGTGGATESLPGGAGAAIGTGDITAGGAPGEAGFYNSVSSSAIFSWGGAGGSSVFGGGARASFAGVGNFNGFAASNYGSGGSGANSFNLGAGATGGNGSGGVVIVVEFAGRGAPGRDGTPGSQGPIGPTGPSGAGTGDVLRSGTPAVGQIAQWTDASHIKGVATETFLPKKNYIINGAMMVSQENGSTAGTVSDYYPVDQFRLNDANSGARTVAQVASRTPSGSPNRVRITVTTADAAVAASDYSQFLTSIEGYRAADLNFGLATAKTITLQFGVKAPAGTYCVGIRNHAVNRVYISEYVISAGEANTDIIKSVTIPGDQAGTWTVDNTRGLYIDWCLMTGTTSQTPAGVWTAGTFLGSPNQFNFMGTNGNVFELFDVGLYAGTIAPAFVVPDFASELQVCKRYWAKSYGYNVRPGTNMGPGNNSMYLGGGAGDAYCSGSVVWPVQMRAAPTLTVYNNSGGGGNGSFLGPSGWQDGATINVAGLTDAAVGFFVGTSGVVQLVNFDYTVNARM